MARSDRATALSLQLLDVHNWLRVRLAALRDPGTADPAELRAHCLAFCSVLDRHHRDEDDGVFPTLAREYPELGPVLRQLRDDHEVVATILGRLADLAEARTASPDPVLQTELDGLAALLESHFTYEERTLAAIVPPAGLPDLRTVLANR